MNYAPISFLSAREGRGVDETLVLARELFDQARKRVTTGELNRVFARALAARSPNRGGHSVRIRYATQAEVAPPTFVLFVNDKKHFTKDYLRYLQNRIQDELVFSEVPVRIVLRDRDGAPNERDRERPDDRGRGLAGDVAELPAARVEEHDRIDVPEEVFEPYDEAAEGAVVLEGDELESELDEE